MAEARIHHYIPQCYLRGFSTGNGKRCKVQVACLRDKRFFETNPKNICAERDFMRFEACGENPNFLEKEFSQFETLVSDAIKRVSESGTFEGEDKTLILNLIAILAVRSPERREYWREVQERVLKKMMEVSLATKERWESQMAGMKAAGYTVDDSLTYEDMKKFQEEGGYRISFKREHHIGFEMSSFDTVLPLLFERKWTLYRTKEERGFFVTTDSPVLLAFLEPERIPRIYSPGFGLKKTEVMFPLTKADLLIGEFEHGYGTRDAPIELVAMANTKMMYHATVRAFMAKRTIRYMALSSEQTWHDAHFMERFVEEGEKLRKQAEAIAKAQT